MGPEIYDEAYYAGRGVDPLVDYESEYTNYRATPRVEEFAGLVALVQDHWTRSGSKAADLRWLDYGCGAGGLLKFLRDRGRLGDHETGPRIVASGFDVGTYADRLRAVDQLDVHTAATLGALPDGQFDVISLVEVIEHLEQPMPVLGAVSRWLKPGGLLLLTTGNLASPLARWQGIRFGYCIPEIHVTLWTPAALVAAYQRVGLLPYSVRCPGSMRFKIRKNLDRVPMKSVAAPLLCSAVGVRLMDHLFGVSAMPMAIKPFGAGADARP